MYFPPSVFAPANTLSPPFWLVANNLSPIIISRSKCDSFPRGPLEQYCCTGYYFAKTLQGQTVIREKLHKALLYKKVSCKMLMKLTPVSMIGGPEKLVSKVCSWKKNTLRCVLEFEKSL